jgi:thiamine monophosphate synthase
MGVFENPLFSKGTFAIARAVRVPVLAIGGVTLATVREVASCGVAGIAGIGLFLPRAMTMTQVVARIRAAFDRPHTTTL